MMSTLRHLDADTAYEIYLGDDFSTPQPSYREVSDPERGTRFVLAAPFFIKVFLLHRRRVAVRPAHPSP